MISTSYPIMFIQCDWNEALRLPNSEAWISVKSRSETSKHGRITTSGLPSAGKDEREGRPKCTITEEFALLNITTNMLSVKHLESGLVTTFVSPMKSFSVHKKGLLSVCAAENAMVVSSSQDGKVVVWDSRTGEELLNLKGHGGPVYKCRFFPSGVVVLTAGADCSLKIWSAENGINPVTMSGHSMAVTDICVVDKGRNIISVSKDGKVKLWDVGESKCLTDIISVEASINSCCIVTTSKVHSPKNPREIATDDKLIVVGCEDGSVHCAHIATREIIFSIKLDSAVNCVASFEYSILAGCESGKVLLLSSTDGSIINEWWESASPVLSLHSLQSNKFVIGKQDGTCIVYSLDHSAIRVQLTGSDCDPIRDICFNGRWVFTACRDSLIRKYDYNQLAVHFK